MKAISKMRAFWLVILCFVLPNLTFAQGFKEKLQQRINNNSFQYKQSAPAKRKSKLKLERITYDKKDVPREMNYELEESMLLDKDELGDEFFSAYAIYRTEYKAELEENVVTVNGNIVFEVFKEHGWTKIPLVSSAVGLVDVKVNRGTSYIVMKSGKYYLMIDRPGRYSLEIEFLIKASREREYGPGSFKFDTVPAPISQFEFTIAESDLQIFIEPSIKIEQKKDQNKTVAWAVMPNTSAVSVRWTKALPKEEITQVKLTPKLYADIATHISIGEGVMRAESVVNYSILQSEVSTFTLNLPEDVNLLNVRGQELRDWKVSQKEGHKRLDVFLNFGIKGKYQLAISYERDIGEGSVVATVPELKVVGVERETGYVGVAATTNVELEINKSEGVTVIDTKQLPSTIWGRSLNPILLAFKYLGHPYGITIDVTRHEELPVLVAAVDSTEYITLYTEEGKTLTQAIYQVRNNVKQFLRLVLPEEATLWSSFVGGKPVKPAKDKKGNVLIPLEKSKLQGEDLRQFSVEIVYLNESKKMKFLGGSLKLELPKVDIPSSQVYWSVYFPYEYSYYFADGDMKQIKRHHGLYNPVKRSMKGRLQAVSDQVGQQYMGRSETFSVNEGRSMNKGMLPIKITIPHQGELMRFSKLLVTGDESPWIKLRYTKISKYIIKAFWLLIWLLIIFLLGKKIVKRIRKPKKIVDQ
jgi:hypothetical protein